MFFTERLPILKSFEGGFWKTFGKVFQKREQEQATVNILLSLDIKRYVS